VDRCAIGHPAIFIQWFEVGKRLSEVTRSRRLGQGCLHDLGYTVSVDR
jgi:hypothetical protein